jgi:predicted RNA-binding Zn-ribbon protein involved in translation (DUF1610 family)
MSNAKAEHGFAFECDDCGDTWEPPRLGRGSTSRDFAESWELAKDEGWRAHKATQRGLDTWKHRCPKCC